MCSNFYITIFSMLFQNLLSSHLTCQNVLEFHLLAFITVSFQWICQWSILKYLSRLLPHLCKCMALQCQTISKCSSAVVLKLWSAQDHLKGLLKLSFPGLYLSFCFSSFEWDLTSHISNKLLSDADIAGLGIML